MTDKILVRAPFRLGLAGGGTDVVPYSYELEGAVVNVAINKYCFVTIEPCDATIFISHDLQITDRLNSKSKSSLKLHRGVHKYFEGQQGNSINVKVTTQSEAPAGSGLGSSSTIVVALVKAYACFLKLNFDNYNVAETAIKIERSQLSLAGGLQDQFAATFGGMNFINFTKKKENIINAISTSEAFLGLIESNMLLINSGSSRDSSKIIDVQKKLASEKNASFMSRLLSMRELAFSMKACLLREDYGKFIEIMNESWLQKRDSADLISNELTQKIEKDVLSSGALAFKVSGAGGGGFCQVYTDVGRREKVKIALMKLGYRVENVSFERLGASAWIFR